jgi:hypothetical protein
MMLPIGISKLAVGAIATKKKPIRKLVARLRRLQRTAASAAVTHSAAASSVSASSRLKRQPNSGMALKE